MFLRALAFGAAIVCGWPAVALHAASSKYTTILPRDCTSPADLTPSFAARQLGVQECPAVGDWRLLLVSSQENTWIELRAPGVSWSGEQSIVYDSPIGLFPSVGASPRVEWRLDARGVPTALIVRVGATSRADARTRVGRLFVVRLQSDHACVIGRVTTNRQARALADGPARCPAVSRG
jgi:hypothetical protein